MSIYKLFFGIRNDPFVELFIKPLTKIDGLFPGVFVSLFLTTLFYFMGGRQKVFTDKEMKQMNVEAGIYEKVL